MNCKDPNHKPEADGYCAYCRPYPDGGCKNPYHNSDWSDGYCPGCNRGRYERPWTEADRERKRNLPLCPEPDCWSERNSSWGMGCICEGPDAPYRSRGPKD